MPKEAHEKAEAEITKAENDVSYWSAEATVAVAYI
ncbi:hypothetical protein B738_04881, partial [Photorhabdus temperata subsp. temperata M1021]